MIAFAPEQASAMGKPHVVILGAGPAGLGAAFRLARRGLARVTVLEKNPGVGGNASSFELGGLRVDYGSHRLHPACDPEILADIRSLLGQDLLDRPRHGRIRLCGRWVHFPIKPLDLARRLPPSFLAGAAADLVKKIMTKNPGPTDNGTFASVLEQSLGRTLCRDFYFPYARKIWGLDPEELSAAQARRRVSANSLGKMARKALSALPGLKTQGSGRFFYPRQGYGQISEAYHRAAARSGAEVLLNARLESIETVEGAVQRVRYLRDGQYLFLPADHVWSTIPITVLARSVRPSPPQELLQAAEVLSYRGMILIYLLLEQERFSEYDAHYFPEPEIPISRLSEPKNYSDGQGPRGLTVLCAELPCAPDGPEWEKSDEELGELVCRSLEGAGIAVRAPVKEVVTRRLRQAYPIYRKGYELYFDRLDQWLGQIKGLLTFGRQGLFAHDNTHHALYMGYSAAASLREDGSFDQQRWRSFRRVFDTHVVED